MTGLSHNEVSAAPSARRIFTRLFIAALLCAAANSAIAQSNGCELTSDERNPNEKVLRCGATLVVRTAPGTSYRSTGAPNSLELYDGALLIEFHPSNRHRTFQILTPHAVVAVRGTKWAVDVTSERSSVFVAAGSVEVTRPTPRSSVTLKPGEGTDVDKGSTTPLVVKRWAEQRVRALLSRFGE